jgi:hypothetical protein
MTHAKHYIIACAALLSISQLHAQKDSVESLFKAPKLNVHYSYLQFEFGYTGFVFNGTYLNGTSYDLIGAVFNDDVDVAIGFDQCGGASRYSNSFSSTTTTVQSYSDFYIKAEPLLFPDKVFNFSVPIKLCVATLSYPIPMATGRRRTMSYGFAAATGGAFFYVNLFRPLSLGAGADYRLSFTSSSQVASNDYSNFSFSVLARLKIYTRATGRRLAAKKNDYYDSKDRFQ